MHLANIDVEGVPILRRPEDLNIMVAGGVGKHSLWLPDVDWSSQTRPL
jgi:hypothetical protein